MPGRLRGRKSDTVFGCDGEGVRGRQRCQQRLPVILAKGMTGFLILFLVIIELIVLVLIVFSVLIAACCRRLQL
jgi:hypothetical protein